MNAHDLSKMNRVLDQFDLEAEAEGAAIRRSNNLRPQKTPGWRTMKTRQKIERGKRIIENKAIRAA